MADFPPPNHLPSTPPKLPLSPPPVPLVISADMLAPKTPKDLRLDFEKGISYAPLVALILIACNVVVFGWQLGAGTLESKETIIGAGALYRPLVLQGEIWRLVTAMFLHGGFDHIIGNCLVLYVVGMACEHCWGRGQTVLIYFVSGICGSLLSVTMQPGPSVGASGAIFGVTGAVIVFLHRYQHAFFVRDKRIGIVLAIWAGYQIVTGFLSPIIDNSAHIGGLVGGAVTALALKPRLVTMQPPSFQPEKPLPNDWRP